MESDGEGPVPGVEELTVNACGEILPGESEDEAPGGAAPGHGCDSAGEAEAASDGGAAAALLSLSAAAAGRKRGRAPGGGTELAAASAHPAELGTARQTGDDAGPGARKRAKPGPAQGHWMPFAAGLEHARALGLKRWRQWLLWSKSGDRPPAMPSNPHIAYAKSGWKGCRHWLGTEQ